jgi:UDP-N-acetylglucosamine transferase subunit ALG13
LILVITGTHEQPFNRLIAAADELALGGRDVMVQYGSSSPPLHAEGFQMFTISELRERAQSADVIVTHGGPGALWEAFSVNKIPVAVPRMRLYGEHVDNHQLTFVRHMADHKRVIAVFDPDTELLPVVDRYPSLSTECIPPKSRAEENRKAVGSFLDAWLGVD